MASQKELLERRKSIDDDGDDRKSDTVGPHGSKLESEQSRTLKWAIQQLKPVQVWDWLFRSCEGNGRILLREGIIDIKDIEQCILKGKCHKLGIRLPAWCILQCQLASAKANSTGLLLSEEMDTAKFNWPKDKLLGWFIGPLLIIKEQIHGLNLDENEESCLKKLMMNYNNEKPEDWNDTGFPSDDNVRRAQLQAFFRRLQGIVAFMTRMPTFRRRFNNLVKVLYVDALQNGATESQHEGNSRNITNIKKYSIRDLDAKLSSRNFSRGSGNDMETDKPSGEQPQDKNEMV